MSLSFYDASVGAYLQTLGGVANVLEKGKSFALQGELDLDEVVNLRLRDDMAPFTFQVLSVWHHSLGAIKGLKAGGFEPPPKMAGLDYARCQALIAEAIEGLESENPDDINALADQTIVFRVGGSEIPFTNTHFLTSVSLPNFYFHATTTYDMLRMQGVPLGKMDYLGQLKTGA